MKLIAPITITDTILSASNVAETDHPEWGPGMTYAAGARVISTASHAIYQSVTSGNLGNDPVTDDGSKWLYVSATNRWKPFDQTIQDRAERAGTLAYSITPNSLVTGLAFLGLEAAQVHVEIFDTEGQQVFDKILSLVDVSEVVDWFSFFTWDAENYDSEALFVGVPGYAGNRIDITIGDGTGTAKVGQIVIGKLETLGVTLDGASIGINDFSIKGQDDFGNLSIIERGFADEVSFPFALATSSARRVKRLLAELRATPAVYFAGEDIPHFGATVFGYYEDFDIPLSRGGTSYATLSITGLV